jgi:beta-glucosidase
VPSDGGISVVNIVHTHGSEMQLVSEIAKIWQRRVTLVALLFSSATALAKEPTSASLAAFDSQAKAILARMTLDEKIGQMTQAELSSLGDLTDISKYCLGSVLSGGNSDPRDGNSPEAWRDAYDSCQREALQTRLRIPLLYGVDAVHGHNNVLGAVIFPHNIGLGCAGDPDLVEKIAQITAEEVRATGINWAFAPCVTVPQDVRWGRTYEGFSEEADLTSLLGAAAVRGLQRGQLRDPRAVLACAKHFVGDGGTAFGSSLSRKNGLDQGDTRIDEATLRRIHMKPYRSAIEAGVGAIMPSFSSWNGTKCSANKYLLTDVLKGELGFEGFLISDYDAIDQVAGDYKKAVELSIGAGMDMVMVPKNYKVFVNDLRELVDEGRVAASRIDDAVTRILRVKCAMGLFDDEATPFADRSLHESLGSEEHRAVARDAVRKSLVVLKNDRQTLPISKHLRRIHVAGHSADDIGKQCGGWTISWQGASGEPVNGTTILEAIRSSASAATEVTFSADGAGGKGADLGVIVIGESPYAEGEGDSSDLALAKADLEAVTNMNDLDIPTVIVLVSGRPLLINDVLDHTDAFVAAWLPGTEGQGVADVLFGDFRPTGRLSFTWPKSLDQLPVRSNRQDGHPLFELGYGLTYSH